MDRTFDTKLLFSNSRNSASVLAEILQKALLFNVDICVISDSPTFEIPDKFRVFSANTSSNLRVSVLLPCAFKAQQFLITHGNCVFLILTINEMRFALAGCYFPCNMTAAEFRDNLNEIQGKILLLKVDVAVLCGDLNATITCRNSSFTTSREKGETLKSWCCVHDWSMYTYGDEDWTYLSPLGARHTIDHLVIRTKYSIFRLPNVYFDSSHVGGDHRLVLSTIRISRVARPPVHFVQRKEVIPVDPITTLYNRCPVEHLRLLESSLFTFTISVRKDLTHKASSISNNILRMLRAHGDSRPSPQLMALVDEAQKELWDSIVCNKLFIDSIDRFECKRNPWRVIRKIINNTHLKDLTPESNPIHLEDQLRSEEEAKKPFKSIWDDVRENPLLPSDIRFFNSLQICKYIASASCIPISLHPNSIPASKFYPTLSMQSTLVGLILTFRAPGLLDSLPLSQKEILAKSARLSLNIHWGVHCKH